MILDVNSFRKPVRPPIFLKQLAAQQAANLNKCSRQLAKPVAVDNRVQVAVIPVSAPIAPRLPKPVVAPPKPTRVRTYILDAYYADRTEWDSNIEALDLQPAAKVGASRYYQMTATSLEAYQRDKWH